MSAPSLSSKLWDQASKGNEVQPQQQSKPRKAPALIPLEAALSRALALVEAVPETEPVPLAEAHGRVNAAAVTSPWSLPMFDNSAMDGYAVRTAECRGQPPFWLRVAGRMAAGDACIPPPAGEGVAIRIFTGAMVPPDFDAVVMQEDCRGDGDFVLVGRRPPPGNNIRRAGEDLAEGGEIVAGGTLLDARHVALLAAAGIASVAVRRTVQVALFSTGTELRQPGETVAPGQIYDSNGAMLRALLCRPFIRLRDLGAVGDDPARLERTLRQAAGVADVIVTTGGVSVGDEDHMHRLIVEAGGTLDVMRVAIKPGKPVTVGRLGQALYLGLPGNPVSAFVTFALFGHALIGRRAGQAVRPPAAQPAVCEDEVTRSTGRQEYLPVRIAGNTDAGLPKVRMLTPAGSAMLARLAGADGLVVVPPQQERICSGEQVAFIPIREML